MAGDYTLCGWRVRSEIALPELDRWTGDDRAPELSYVLGPVPPRFEAPRHDSAIVQVDDAGRVRIEIENVCTYLVEGGTRITIDPQVPADAPDIRLFLLGGALGVICHQKGLLPIHGSAVEVDGRALLFAGPSGAGKSTLADAFARHGYRVLADDVGVLALSGEDAGLILPGHRLMRLWRDAAERAHWPVDSLETCRDDLDKFSRPLGAQHAPAPIRPAALMHLAGGRFDTIAFEPLRGATAIQTLRQQTYRWRTLVGLLGRGEALARVAAGAPLIPQHILLKRPLRFGDLDATVEAVVAFLRDQA